MNLGSRFCRAGIVLLLGAVVGACAGGGGGGGGGGSAASNDPVDKIVNAADRASHTNHWNINLGVFANRDWAFFSDGTGAFRDANSAPSGRMFTWSKTGPDALVVVGPTGLSISSTWTEISGSLGSAAFSVVLNGNPTRRTFTLQGGTIINPATPTAGELVLTDPGSTALRVRDKATLVEVRSISGGNTGLSIPTGVAVHAGRQEIFVANSGNNSIAVHAAGASGNVPPLRLIKGAQTGLQFSSSRQVFTAAPFNGIYVDEVRGEVGVVNDAASPASITVYGITANGDATPLRTIQGASTTLASPIAIAVDTLHDEIFVNDLRTVSNPSHTRVTVFSRTASGNAAPLRTLDLEAIRSGPPLGGGFTILGGLAVDAVNGELWTVGAGGLSTRPGLLVFARTAAGTEPPLRTGSSSLRHHDLLVDPTSGEAVLLRNAAVGQRVIEVWTLGFTVLDTSPAPTEVGVALLP